MTTVPNPQPQEEPRARNELLVAALEYARMGIRVFPLWAAREDGTCTCNNPNCTDQGKHPHTKNGLADATTSETQIRKWWKQWPNDNIGGRTGSKMVVLDSDSSEGVKEATNYGVDFTAIHDTSRPGHNHYYFRPPEGVVLLNKGKKSGNWPLQYCDARGEGGYAVLPPSRHYTGSTYEMSERFSLDKLLEVPARLLEVWRTPKEDPRAAVLVWDETDGVWAEEIEECNESSGAGFDTARYFLRRYIQEVKDGADRNPTGLLLALQLRDAGLTQDQAEPFMRRYQTAVETIKREPYEWREAKTSLAQAYTRPKRTSASSQDKPRKVEFSWREHVFSAANLMKEEIVVKPFLVDELLPQGFTLLGGRPKSGKSVLSLQLALATAGDKVVFLDRAVEHGRVLYLALEDPKSRLQSRIDEMASMLSVPRMEIPERFDMAREWPKWPQGGLDYLDEYVDAYPDTVLVVIDTMADFRGPIHHGGGYDVDYDFSRALSDWVNKHGISLLGVTHTGKRKATDDPEYESLDMIQNTTGITAGADTVLVMARAEGVMNLYRSGRDLENTDPIKLTHVNDGIAWSEDSTVSAMSARDAVLFALTNADRPMKPTEMGTMMGVKGGTIRKALHEMLLETPPEIGVLNGAYYLAKRGPTNKPVTGQGQQGANND